MKRHRVGFYLPDLDAGGAQRVTVNVANGLAERGHEVDLVVSDRGGEFAESVAPSVTVSGLSARRFPGAGIGADLRRLVAYLETVEPAVLVSAMVHANVVALAAGRLADSRTRVVATEHTTFGDQQGVRDRLVNAAARRLYRSADRVIAVSEGVAESVRERTVVDPTDVEVVYNPVVTDRLRELARRPPDHRWLADEFDTILGVGRLEPEKDFQTLVDAVALVAERRPSVRLVLLGEGSQRDALSARAREKGVAERVEVRGYVENPYGFMSGADLLALSSVREGLPTVLVEAMACGCPVVSTDCPSGPREILDGGEYGPLVPTRDAVALADAIDRTLVDPPPPERLRQRANSFTDEAVLDDYEALLADLIRRTDRRRR
jgi:glycosyltransferase involved in cell wall biosynthesis